VLEHVRASLLREERDELVQRNLLVSTSIDVLDEVLKPHTHNKHVKELRSLIQSQTSTV